MHHNYYDDVIYFYLQIDLSRLNSTQSQRKICFRQHDTWPLMTTHNSQLTNWKLGILIYCLLLLYVLVV